MEMTSEKQTNATLGLYGWGQYIPFCPGSYIRMYAIEWM